MKGLCFQQPSGKTYTSPIRKRTFQVIVRGREKEREKRVVVALERVAVYRSVTKDLVMSAEETPKWEKQGKGCREFPAKKKALSARP